MTSKAPRARFLLLGAGAALVAIAGYVGVRLAPSESAEEQWAFIDHYCVDCHNRLDLTADIAFDALGTDGITHRPEIFESAVRKLRGRTMPPPGAAQPERDELNRAIGWLEATLDAAAAERPGHVVLQRLNRVEYATEIKRLLALDIDAEALLPQDPESHGFTNIAAALQVSPTFIEQYLTAARDVSIAAVGNTAARPSYEVFTVPAEVNQTVHVEALPLGTRGGAVVTYHFPADGEYEISLLMSSSGGSLLRSYPTGWLEYRHEAIVTIDGREIFRDALGGAEDLKAVDQQQIQAVQAIQARFRNIRVPITAGPHEIGAAFIARTFAESDAELEPLRPGEGVDSVPLIAAIEILGPLQVTGIADTPSRRAIFSCRPRSEEEAAPCAERILGDLAAKAFRRPVTESEVKTLLGFYEAGAAEAGFEGGIQTGIAAILSSPKFLYRTFAPPADSPPGAVYPLDDGQLATRLSFFLWSQGPDAELAELAERGELHRLDVYDAEIERMLADERSRSLITHFAFNWLNVGGIDHIDPDTRLFPSFDEDLREAFRREMELFVDSILRGNRSVLELLTAKHTLVNERLARHYDIPSVRGSGFRQVELEDSSRWGLLGKGSVLLVTSYPDRTSPVLRGAWIMENLIGTPPAAPPPGVETNLADPPGGKATTVRERLEQHRELPSCSQCHAVIDPLGMALENFDAIGEWRDVDRYAGTPIDASDKLVDGRVVSSPDDLRAALLEQPDRFVQTFVERLLMFALGRTLEHYDMPAVRAIVRRAAAEDYRFYSIVKEIARSDPFMMTSVPGDESPEASGH